MPLFDRAGSVFSPQAICFPSSGRQMLTVAVEWEIYARTHSATALGLVGLVFAFRSCAFASGRAISPIDSAANGSSRSRRSVSAICSRRARVCFVATSRHSRLADLCVHGNDGLASYRFRLRASHRAFISMTLSFPLIYLHAALRRDRAHFWLGGAQLIFSDTGAARRFLPMRSPGTAAFSRSARWSGRRSADCSSSRAGFPFIYALDAICAFLFFLLVLPIRAATQERRGAETRGAALEEGIRFILSKKVILATITLDMFAVLLGGATALLPIFADQILHCGPIGLGWMRAAPGIGAFIMALVDCLSAADEARGQNAALVRDRVRTGDDHFRFVPQLSGSRSPCSFLTGVVRQRERGRCGTRFCNCSRPTKCAGASRP